MNSYYVEGHTMENKDENILLRDFSGEGIASDAESQIDSPQYEAGQQVTKR